MNRFIQYWQHVPSSHRILILLGGMVLFWIAEGYYPLFRHSFRRYRHAGVNLLFLLTTIVLNLIFGLVTIAACSYVSTQHIGIINWFNLPGWVSILTGLLLGDLFGQYLPHYIMHKVKWMWKFHMIHHSDTHVDVTTGTRHHPGEWLVRETFMILGVFVMGMPVWLYFLYRSVSALFTHFNHANIIVPEWIDKPISWIFVSPNMHKVHHHYERPFTDSNYSNIFSLWDRLFGTFRYTNPRSLRYGLDVLADEKDEQLGYLFKIPFDKNVKTDY
jgi:sterol desaturase/sphingolipid hydroxylase (fatty acid hydroxylase superfamily)